MAKGGIREGAGRPKGARTLIKAIDYFNEKELKEFWENMKVRAKTDAKIALYFAEQFTGKAMQPVQADIKGSLILQFDNAFTPETKTDSTK